MSFLNEEVVLNILYTYRLAEKIEKDLLTKSAGAVMSGFISWLFNKNTTETSVAAYLELRSHIKKAFKEESSDLFAELTWIATECGHHTLVNSTQGSDLSSVAFAIRSYFLYKIDEQFASMKWNQQYLASLKSNKSYNFFLKYNPLYIEFLKTHLKEMTDDQKFAFNIQVKINERISSNKHYINLAQEVISYAETLKFSFKLANNSIINALIISKIKHWLAESISIAQRQLYCFGDTTQSDLGLNIPKGLFPESKYALYNPKEFKLDFLSEKMVILHLPMAYQPSYIFFVSYLRNKFTEYKHENSDGTVISKFEKGIGIRIEEEAKGNEKLDQSRQQESDKCESNIYQLTEDPEYTTKIDRSPLAEEKTDSPAVNQNYTAGLVFADDNIHHDSEEQKLDLIPKKENSSTQLAFETFGVPVKSPEPEKLPEITQQEEISKTPLAKKPPENKPQGKPKRHKGKNKAFSYK